MSQERFRYLLQRYKSDSLSAAEMEEWRELIRSEAYKSIIESDMEAFMADPVPDKRWTSELERETWENILPGSAGPDRRTTLIKRFRPFLLPAAAACLLAAFGTWWITQRSSARAPVYKVAETLHGKQDQMILTDGTKVWLNAASSLRYPAKFGGPSREVELEGEAYFEVSHSSSLPFKVKAGNLEVEVLGTRFDIEAYAGQLQSHTALLEGSVRVRNGSEGFLLKPGQEAVLQAGKEGLQLHSIKEDQVLAWKNNMFSFDSTLLPEVMNQLERWYDVLIEKKGSISDTVRITGFISRKSTIADVLKMLQYTAGVHYSIQGRKVTLSVER